MMNLKVNTILVIAASSCTSCLFPLKAQPPTAYVSQALGVADQSVILGAPKNNVLVSFTRGEINLKLVDSETGLTLVSTSVKGEAISLKPLTPAKMAGIGIGAVNADTQSTDSVQSSTDRAMAEALTKAFHWIEQQSSDIPQEPKADANAGTLRPERLTVSLGMPMDSVTAALGAPRHIVDLGQKTIYVYQDLKITFKNGKVSDVQ